MISANSKGGFSLVVPSPLGFPPVFYRSDSLYGQQLRSFVIEQNYTYGYSWHYDESKSDHKTWWWRQTLAVRISLVGGVSLFLLIVLYWTTSVYCGQKKTHRSAPISDEEEQPDPQSVAVVAPTAPPSEAHHPLLPSARPI